jgi:hypothetical protein
MQPRRSNTHLAQLLEEAECFLAGGLHNQSHRQLTADRALSALMFQKQNIPFLELSVCHQHQTEPAHACQTWLLFLLRQLSKQLGVSSAKLMRLYANTNCVVWAGAGAEMQEPATFCHAN